MSREEVKQEIIRLISENIDGFNGGSEEKAAEAIMQYLEKVEEDGAREVVVYSMHDPDASWNQPK